MSRVDWVAERQVAVDRHAADVRAAGLGHIWDHLLSLEDSASRGVALGVVGALGTCLREMGYSPPA